MVSRYAIPLLIAAGLVSGLPRVEAAPALTLDAYFTAALQRSEVVATQSELIRQAEERNKQASAALLPTLNGVASYTWQEEPPPGAPGTTPSNLSRQPLAKLTANQPLFRGFREFAALRQTRALTDAQGADYRNARLLLFKDVVLNYYTVLSLEQDLRNLGEEIRQNEEREKDIQARIRIGRSRVSEVLNVQATISTLRAQIEQQQGQLSVARESLAFLSGLDAATPLKDSEPESPAPEPLDHYLAGVPERPDVQASEKRLAAAQENVTIAKGAHLPSLDLNGNYYFERPGYLDDINWDVQVALTIPIYSGGSLQSKVREAGSQQTQAELALSQVRRLAEQEVRSLYDNLLADRAQVAAFEKSTEAARKSYEAQSREYRLGLVTNLDVLQALTTYQQNQRALDRARFTAKLDFLRLLASSSRRPELSAERKP
jgi:outer membrane protein